MVSMIMLCAFTVFGGIEVLGRIAQLFFPLFVIPILFCVILLSPDFEVKNIFPILGGGILPPLKGSIVRICMVFGIFLDDFSSAFFNRCE